MRIGLLIAVMVIGITQDVWSFDIIAGIEKVLGESDTVALVKVQKVESTSEEVESASYGFSAVYKVKILEVIAGDPISGEITVPFTYHNGYRAAEEIYRSGIEEELRAGREAVFLLRKDGAHRTYRLLRAESPASKAKIKTLSEGDESLFKQKETEDPIKKAIEVSFKGRGIVGWDPEIVKTERMDSELIRKYFPRHQFYAVTITNPREAIKGPSSFECVIVQHYWENPVMLTDIPAFMTGSLYRPLLAQMTVAGMADIAQIYAELLRCDIRSAPYDKETEIIELDWAFVVTQSADTWQVSYALGLDPRISRAQRFTITFSRSYAISVEPGKVVEQKLLR
jgi:hypothetical protein